MKFKCGCNIPDGKMDFDNITMDCPATWELISSGYTKGVFQLEKNLGKRFSKELAPSNIEELSDLISLIRPGCLEAEYREDPDKPGKMMSITTTYVRTKSGEIEPEYIHPVLEPIFAPTYGVPVYQEQIMWICTDFAGFSLQEADDTRKAVGKKKKDVMEKVSVKFIEGALKQGHTQELAETVFSWIDKFSGYGFNKSHGICYAIDGYHTAYAKRHFPLAFFKAMLANSDGKTDSLEEIKELVHEARLFNIEVAPPHLGIRNMDFAIKDESTIVFGLGHIKGVGQGAIKSLEKISLIDNEDVFLAAAFAKGKGAYCDCGDPKCKHINKVKKNVVEALIKSGSVDHITKNRIAMLSKYRILSGLTARERDFIFKGIDDGQLFEYMIEKLCQSNVPNKNRKVKIDELVKSISKELGGNHKKMGIGFEKFLLGIPLSGSEVDLHYNPQVNIKCRDYTRLSDGTTGKLGVVIENIKTIKDKNGNHMCFLTVSDDTYMIDGVVVFSSYYKHCSWILEEGKPVLITGKKDRESFIARKIEHL